MLNNLKKTESTETTEAEAETILESLISQSNDLVYAIANGKENTKRKGELRNALTKTIIKIMVGDIKISSQDWRQYRSNFAAGSPLHSIRDILTHAQNIVENFGVLKFEGTTVTKNNFEAFSPSKLYKAIVLENKTITKKWALIQENIEGYAFMSLEVALKNLGKETIESLFAQARLAQARQLETESKTIAKLRQELKALKAANNG